jgi:hypothetical protein
MKIARTGITRTPTRLFYVKNGAIWSSPRAGIKGQAEKVVSFDAVLDHRKFLYYIDADGDVAAKPKSKS